MAQADAASSSTAEPEFVDEPSFAAPTLDEVEVEDDLVDEADEPVSRSTNRITRQELQERSPRDIYDALLGTPGVAIEGGARQQGKRISIRGYSDNEDVLVKIDGANQNFEKYRYGSGIDIDTELVRTIDVVRGAATLTQGAGALGGVVRIETVDPADLLAPGERYGGEVALGYASNDRSHRLTGNLFARPIDGLELLYSKVDREGGNLRFPGGEELADSAESSNSTLYKIVGRRAAAEAEIMVREGGFEGLQPFDVATGTAGVFGVVRRLTDENSTTLNAKWLPESAWFNIEASAGKTIKQVIDQDSPLAPGVDNFFDYDIRTADLRNTARWEWGPWGGKLALGIQANRETRDTFSASDDPALAGPNEAQPPGTKATFGSFIEHELFVGDFTLKAALRRDTYDITAGGVNAGFLEAQGRETQIAFTRLSPGVGLEYNPGGGPLNIFYDYFESFRPPLVDEYFTAGPISRCVNFRGYRDPPTLTAQLNVLRCNNEFTARNAACSARPPIQRGACFSASAASLNSCITTEVSNYTAAVAAFTAAQDAYAVDPFARNKAICGDAYVPESARNHEIGLSYITDGLLRDDDHFYAKASYFHSAVSNTLESLYQDSVTGEILQPGVETRMGVEAQFTYAWSKWQAEMAISTLWGSFDLRYYDNNVNTAVSANATLADRGPQSLFDTPGNSLTLSLARNWHATFVAGYRIRATAPRKVVEGLIVSEACSAAGSFVFPSCNIYGLQEGFVLHNLYVHWDPQPSVSVQLAADNLTNETYNLTGFGGAIGIVAPGRDVSLTLRIKF